MAAGKDRQLLKIYKMKNNALWIVIKNFSMVSFGFLLSNVAIKNPVAWLLVIPFLIMTIYAIIFKNK